MIHTVLMPINDEMIAFARTNFPEFVRNDFSEKRQINYLLGRSLLFLTGKMLYQWDKLPEIIYEQYGKPIFKHSDIQFNLSHSKNTIALIIGKSAYLGIDIEAIKPRKNLTELMIRTCQNDEITWINHSQQLERFYRIWSLKEAYLKTTGNGIRDLSKISFLPDKHHYNGELLHLQFKNTILNNESLAICLPKNDSACTTLKLMPNGLFSPFGINWDLLFN